VPLGYQHVYTDPLAVIGTAHCLLKSGDRMTVLAKLNLEANPQARSVHERLLLPTTDAGSLNQLSVGFGYPVERSFKDANGIVAIASCSRSRWSTREVRQRRSGM
jgi:hypothetical protein